MPNELQFTRGETGGVCGETFGKPESFSGVSPHLFKKMAEVLPWMMDDL